jgi:hypothetical protein
MCVGSKVLFNQRLKNRCWQARFLSYYMRLTKEHHETRSNEVACRFQQKGLGGLGTNSDNSARDNIFEKGENKFDSRRRTSDGDQQTASDGEGRGAEDGGGDVEGARGGEVVGDS